VTGGTFLLALSAAWSFVRLNGRSATTAYWLVLYGNYMNLSISLFAAATGTRALTPNLGTPGGGSAWQEAVVLYGFSSVGMAMLIGVGLIIWGLSIRSNYPRTTSSVKGAGK
jgi:hydroxylaminobenzene mutase